MHLPDYASCFIPKIWAVKVAVKMRSRLKKMGFGLPICRGDTLNFGHTFSNRTQFRACGRFWLSSVQRARRVADKKEDRRRRRIPRKI